MKRARLLLLLGLSLLTLPSRAEPSLEAMLEYMDFVDYGGGVMFVSQIPADEWKALYIIDTRSEERFQGERISGAVHIDWRQTLARRSEIPRDRSVLLYCDTGMVSAQANFALRAAGWDNVRVLKGGFAKWKRHQVGEAARR
jgi:rhodanese-related sulfurtransferase